jgi:hypothetical protein
MMISSKKVSIRLKMDFAPALIFCVALLAAFLFSLTSGPAQSMPPALTIAPSGTNLISITVTNGVGFGNYEVWWTPVLGNPAAYPWVKTAAGTGGQTNFLVNMAGYQNGFFRVLQKPAIGASTPFISYEAESGNLGGGATIVALTSPPTTEFSSPQLEASGHAYVHLAGTGQNVTLTNTTGKAITALNIRYSIPDAPTGGGISNTIDLYVGGTFRLQIPVTSFQTWVYEATTNYNGMSHDPTMGNPHVFWDEAAFFVPGAAIPPGGTFTLQMDSANTAAYYNIDVIDLETPPPPLAQPSGSLSIMSYGAVSNNPSFDNSTALQNCFNAASSANEIAWIPPGNFYISSGGALEPRSVTIQGAGPWYSAITCTKDNWANGFMIHAVSASFKNLRLEATKPNSTPGMFAVLAYGANWIIDNVWSRHMMLVWGSGTNCAVENSRVNNSWGDGMNINNVVGQVCTNVLIYNNFSRGNGDDAIALNSASTSEPPVQSATVKNNTTVASWWANQFGLYGGSNILVEDNLFQDCVKKTGMELSGYGGPVVPVNVTVQFNTILRGGSFGYGIDQPAMIIEGDGTNMTVINNTISNSMFAAVQVSTGTYNLLFEDNLITAPGTTGIIIPSGTTGTGTFLSNIVESLNSGQSAYIDNAPSTFTATVTGNSWQGGTSGTINFDVPGGAGGANYVGQGAYSDPGNNYWNAIVANGTTPAGTNSDGVTLNTITFTEAQTGQFQGGTFTTEGTPQALEYYYADVTSSATNTCTLNNVPAGTYNLYLYGINGGTGGTRSDRGTTFTVSSDSTPATSQSTVNTSSGFTSFIQGNSFVLFTNILVGTGSTITFTYSHNPNATNTINTQTEGDFNGLQLQSH